MKNQFYFIQLLLLCSVNLYSQENICFNSQTEAKDSVKGTWKLTDETSDVYYLFSLNDEKIHVEIILDLDYYNKNQVEKLMFESNQEIEILDFDDCFNIGIEHHAKFGGIFNKLEFSSKNKFKYLDKVFIRTEL